MYMLYHGISKISTRSSAPAAMSHCFLIPIACNIKYQFDSNCPRAASLFVSLFQKSLVRTCLSTSSSGSRVIFKVRSPPQFLFRLVYSTPSSKQPGSFSKMSNALHQHPHQHPYTKMIKNVFLTGTHTVRFIDASASGKIRIFAGASSGSVNQRWHLGPRAARCLDTSNDTI